MTAVRTLVRSGLKSDVRVVFHGGIYALEAPLVSKDLIRHAPAPPPADADGEAAAWSGPGRPRFRTSGTRPRTQGLPTPEVSVEGEQVETNPSIIRT